MTARLAVLASGGGSNLQAIIDACANGELNADVVRVITNRPEAGALARAAAAGIETTVVDPRRLVPGTKRLDRAVYDARLAEVVGDAEPDWVVLAGWMRILTMSFLGRFPGRVVNLHPALPGQYPGTHAIERAYADFQAGHCDHTGVMVHLVPDEGVDDGPVLATATVPIEPADTLESLTERVHTTEHQLLVNTLQTLILTTHQNADPHACQSR